LKLLSGGSASLASVDDLHLASGRDLNLVVGQKHNAVIGGDMFEQIRGLSKSVAAASQSLLAPKTWVGSESVNVLQVLSDVIDLLEQIDTQLAGHKHGPTPPPDNVGEFTGNAASPLLLGEKLKPITG
jgi:hypothetical protein